MTTMEQAPKMTVGGVIESLFRNGAKFQEVRRVMKERFGVRIDYNGHDRAGGRAMARRRRQIDRGQVRATRYCENPECRARLEHNRTVPLCSTCLENVWK